MKVIWLTFSGLDAVYIPSTPLTSSDHFPWRTHKTTMKVRDYKHHSTYVHVYLRRVRLERDDIRAEIRFGVSEKSTSPFKSAGESVRSTNGSRGVWFSGRPWIAYFLFTSPPTHQRVLSRFKRPLHTFASKAYGHAYIR